MSATAAASVLSEECAAIVEVILLTVVLLLIIVVAAFFSATGNLPFDFLFSVFSTLYSCLSSDSFRAESLASS